MNLHYIMKSDMMKAKYGMLTAQIMNIYDYRDVMLSVAYAKNHVEKVKPTNLSEMEWILDNLFSQQLSYLQNNCKTIRKQ